MIVVVLHGILRLYIYYILDKYRTENIEMRMSSSLQCLGFELHALGHHVVFCLGGDRFLQVLWELF